MHRVSDPIVFHLLITYLQHCETNCRLRNKTLNNLHRLKYGSRASNLADPITSLQQIIFVLTMYIIIYCLNLSSKLFYACIHFFIASMTMRYLTTALTVYNYYYGFVMVNVKAEPVVQPSKYGNKAYSKIIV